ncbi:uncharacterized protein TRIADDRAFT_51344 [Trichoplax adhaerens]|uniref:Uncharacterized protein n=1 Tax=Trichoplax adhaerens TaxID=10228 RepID=B3RIJ9_TRIAD|nr:predicted protein [Trichoplax adhaerens]EDV28436.1 predicted protein [Trichoplax adhaerens]|eukprot:XP_002107638.1 predicted protein [Trichoplax adhaerens]
MKVCCQDFFFSRSKKSDISSKLVKSTDTEPLQAIFRHAKTNKQQINIFEELVETKVAGPNELDLNEGLERHMARFQKYMDTVELRNYLLAQKAQKESKYDQEDTIETKLATLRGEKKASLQPTPKVQAGILRGGYKSVKDIMNSQITHLRGKSDQYNAELVQLLKAESELAAAIKNLEQSSDEDDSSNNLQRAKQQYSTVSMQKREVLNNLTQCEQDIRKKQKQCEQAS